MSRGMINPRRIGDPDLRYASILLDFLTHGFYGDVIIYSDKDNLAYLQSRLQDIRDATWKIEALLMEFEPRGRQITKLRTGGPSLEQRAYFRWRMRHPHERTDDLYPLPRDPEE